MDHKRGHACHTPPNTPLVPPRELVHTKSTCRHVLCLTPPVTLCVHSLIHSKFIDFCRHTPVCFHTDGSDRFPRTGWTFGLFPGSGSYSKATTSVPALPPGQSGDKSPAHGQHRFGSSRGCQTAFLRWVPIPTLPVKERTPGAPCSHQHLSRPSTLATWGGGRWGR